MRAVLFSTAVFAAAVCGCGEQEKPGVTAVSPAIEAKAAAAKSYSKTVILHEGSESDANRVPPVVSRGTEMRIKGVVRIDEKTKNVPNPIVQIVRHEDGRDVVYNSSVTDQTREGDAIKFESTIKAPDKTGLYRVNAIHKGQVLSSSGLTVE